MSPTQAFIRIRVSIHVLMLATLLARFLPPPLVTGLATVALPERWSPQVAELVAAALPAPATARAQGAGPQIGNRVWNDLNANGLQESGEPGIAGATVGLYDSNGDAVQCIQAGRYNNYADGFNGAVSNGSTGNLPWGTTWTFTGSAAAFATQGNPGGSMYVYGASSATATRAVDLSIFGSLPTLSFDYKRGNGAASYNIQYSSDGGTNFTSLDTLSVNNTTYQAITYTLPITVANARIRIQGATGGGAILAYFDNVKVQGQLRYPVTTVTDANGLYTFNDANCVQPNLNYQMRIATAQTPVAVMHLTTQNASGVTNNDPTADDSDSDAANVTVSNMLYAQIDALAPAVGANESYDFGFTAGAGAIIIRKATTPAGSNQTFSFTSNVPGHASFMLSDGDSYTMTNVPVGAYAVTETLPSGWTQAANTCTNNSGVSSGSGAIQVTQNSTTTCSLLNALQPTTSNVLTVTKTVNWNGNAPNAARSFAINITGPSFPGGMADTITAGQTKVYTDVVAGVYTITETSPGAGWVTTYSVPSGVVALSPPVIAATTAGPISGNVFRDYNADGVDAGTGEPGVAGVKVTAYDPTGAVRGSATTDANGNYSFTPNGSGPYRLEFTDLPAGYYPTQSGANNGASTQFVTTNGGASNINLGINHPTDYCQSNPMLCTAEFIAGDPANATIGGESALKKWSYSAANGAVTPTNLATVNLVGTVWGQAYARSTDKLYSAAFLKRHAGLGPNGLGAIYVTSNPRTGTGVTTTLFFDVATLPGVDVGSVPANSARGWAPASTPVDTEVYDKVGKVGLGDLDIADDESTLWTISLNDKKLIGLPVSNPNVATVQVYTIPEPGCTAGSGDYRPFATKYYRGQLYIGVTCDAATSLNRAHLKSIVYRFNPADPGAGFVNVLNIPLNYLKGASYTGCPNGNRWNPWVNSPYPSGFSPVCLIGAVDHKSLPQPLLSDIEFDVDGSLILGFVDRFAHQAAGTGYRLPDNSGSRETLGGGEILRAYNNAGTFVLENNGSAGPVTGGASNGQGPGLGEFYRGDFMAGNAALIQENATGGLALLPGRNEAVTTVWDPFSIQADNGVAFLSNTDGNANRRHAISQNQEFAKGTGLGDLELLCDAAPLEIGNRVWQDLNGNGVQDPGEPGVNSVQVSLQGPTNTVTVNTSGDGTYYFGNLRPSTAYTLTIDPNQVPLNGLNLTQANMQAISGSTSSNDPILDTRDSDAVLVGGVPTIYYTTGGPGQNNHGLDFGFTQPVSGQVDILNTAPMSNIAMTKAANTPLPVAVGAPISFTIRITNTGGSAITTLPLTDTYDVAYLGYNLLADLNGPNPATEPADDGSIFWANVIDFDADGQLAPNESLELIVYFDAKAATTALADDASCLNSSAGQTVNFAAADNTEGCVGVTIDPAPSKSTLGDFVWYDVNGDGVKDAGEEGIDGVRVELYEIIDTNGITSTQFITFQLTGPDRTGIDSDDTPTYGDAGAYDFPVQDNKIYQVVISDDNFLPTGPLAGYLYTGENASSAYNGAEPRVVAIGTQVDYNDADFPFTLPPQLAVSKTLNGVNPFGVGDNIDFTIRITNTGPVTLTVLPLEDRYSNVFLQFVSASVAPDGGSGNGVLTWSDLTTALGDVGPGASVSLTVTFTTLADTTLLVPVAPCTASGHAPNIVEIDGAFADPDGDDGTGDDVAVVKDGDDEDCASVQIFNPTAVQLAVRSLTQTPAGVLVRWAMVDETNVVGFYIWKANGVQSSRRSELIPTTVNGQAGSAAAYQWLDAGATLTRGDAYVLEIVKVDGSSERVVIDVGRGGSLYLPLVVR